MNSHAEWEIIGRLSLALVLGSVVGVEREFRGHQAGVRTNALVCLGAAIFGEVSASLGDDRVAAGVVQGVGFLGAGLIYVRKGQPAGVTTAACIWVIAGVGLLVSARFPLTATFLTVAMIVLLEMAPISDWIYAKGREQRKRKGDRNPDTPYDDDFETEQVPDVTADEGPA